MLPLGTHAPAFRLRNIDEKFVSIKDFQDNPLLVVMFICNHCPYVVNIKDELARLARDYQSQGVGVVAISANDTANYPADSPAKMAAFARENAFTFPYLYDPSQEIAIAYRAACTPDFYVFDSDRRLIYRGQLDDSRPGNDLVPDGKDLRRALDLGLKGETIPPNEQKPSIGCNIKWKPGNAPNYFGG